MSRLSTRVNALLAEARGLRHAQVLADDPARDDAIREELLGRINRLRENMTPEEIAAGRAMSESELAAVLDSCRAQLRERMERDRARS